MAKTREQFYSEEEAWEEAEKIKKLIEEGKAKTYEEAAKIVEENKEEKKEVLIKDEKVKECLKVATEKGIKIMDLIEKLEEVWSGAGEYIIKTSETNVDDLLVELRALSPEEVQDQNEEIESIIRHLDVQKMKQVCEKYRNNPIVQYEIINCFIDNCVINAVPDSVNIVEKLSDPTVFNILSKVKSREPVSYILDLLLSKKFSLLEEVETENFLNYLNKKGKKLLELSDKINSVFFLEKTFEALKNISSMSIEEQDKGLRSTKRDIYRFSKFFESEEGKMLLNKYSQNIDFITRLLERMSIRKDLVDGAEVLLKLPKLDETDLSSLLEIYSVWIVEIEKLQGNLNSLFLEEGPFEEKLKRASLYINLKELRLEIKPPSLSNEWWNEVISRIKEGIKIKYGIEKDLELDEAIPLLEIREISGTPSILKLKEVLEKKEEIVERKKFPLNKIYKEVPVTGLKEKVDPVETTEALVYGLISPLFRKIKNKKTGKEERIMRTEPLKKALTYFEKEKLRGARNYIKGLGPSNEGGPNLGRVSEKKNGKILFLKL